MRHEVGTTVGHEVCVGLYVEVVVHVRRGVVLHVHAVLLLGCQRGGAVAWVTLAVLRVLRFIAVCTSGTRLYGRRRRTAACVLLGSFGGMSSQGNRWIRVVEVTFGKLVRSRT